jgi:hypothetical protein
MSGKSSVNAAPGQVGEKGTDHLHVGPSRRERHQMRRLANQERRAKRYKSYLVGENFGRKGVGA